MGVSTNNNQALENALKKIEEQYAQGMKYVKALEKDTKRIEQDEENLSIFERMGYGWQTIVNELKADLAAAQKDLKTQEDKLKALDPAFEALTESVNSLMEAIYQEANTGFGTLFEDLSSINLVLQQIFSAMGDKLKSDLDLEAIRDSKDNHLTNEEIQQLAEDAAGYQGAEQSTLNSLMGTMTYLTEVFHKIYDDAKADKARYNFWDDAFHNGEDKKANDRAIMYNSMNMIHAFLEIMTDLKPEMAGLSPELQQAMLVIEKVLKEIKKILNDVHLAPKEKQKEVLGLVIFLLSFFQVVQQDVESKKAKNQKNMSQGATEASKMNIDDVLMNQKIKEEEEHNAKIMKITMIVSEVVLGGLMMIAAPGIGTAFLVAMITAFEVLQTEGVVNVTGALGDAIGSKIGADAIVGASEMLFTMGAGAALDQAMATVMQETVENAAYTATRNVEDIVEQAAQEAAIAANKTGDRAAVARAENTLIEVAESASKKAARGVVEQFMKQPFADLVEMMAKGTLRKTVEETAEKAAGQAAEQAVKDAATIAKLAARDIPSSTKAIDDIGTQAAHESVAKASGKSTANIIKESETPGLQKAVSRGLWTALFALGNTNFLVDIAKEAGKSKDEDLLMALQVIEGLLQMLAMMFGSGMMSGTNLETGSGGLTRFANLASSVPQAGNISASYGNYMIYMKESKAVQGITQDGAVSDLLQQYLQQLQKNNNLSNNIFIKDQQQQGQTTQSLASHINDGDLAGIQVLISAAG